MGWGRIAVYTSPGSFTFTVPNGITKIGAAIGSGGGSGAITASCSGNKSSRYYAGVCGGGSGNFRCINEINVTANQNIPIVVGAGGVAPTKFENVWNYDHVDGGDGGASSFNGISVAGGQGGKGYYSTQSDDRVSLTSTGGATGIIGNAATTPNNNNYYNKFDNTYYQFCSGAGAEGYGQNASNKITISGSGATATHGSSASAKTYINGATSGLRVSSSTGLCSGGSSLLWLQADYDIQLPSKASAAAGRSGFVYVYAPLSEMILAGIPEV